MIKQKVSETLEHDIFYVDVVCVYSLTLKVYFNQIVFMF